jgi:hypothetical protein
MQDKPLVGQKRGMTVDENGKMKRQNKDDSGKKKLTLIQRKRLLDDYRDGAGGVKKSDLALRYGISKPRVTQIIADASKIDIAIKHVEPGSTVKRVVDGKFKVVDNGLLDWLRERKDHAVDIESIKMKANILAAEHLIADFSPNHMWLHRFVKKHGLVKRIGEAGEEVYVLEDVAAHESANIHRSFVRVDFFKSVNDVIGALSEMQKLIKTGYGLDEPSVNRIQEHLSRSNGMTATSTRELSVDYGDQVGSAAIVDESMPSASNNATYQSDMDVVMQSSRVYKINDTSNNDDISDLSDEDEMPSRSIAKIVKAPFKKTKQARR